MTNKEIAEFNVLLDIEKHWSRARECRNSEGVPCSLGDLDADAFSLDGALLSVVGDARIHGEALRLILQLGPGQVVHPDNALMLLMNFNDLTTMGWKKLKTRLIELKATGDTDDRTDTE